MVDVVLRTPSTCILHISSEVLFLCDECVSSWCVGVNEAQDTLVELIQGHVSPVQTINISKVTRKHRVRWNNKGRGPCREKQTYLKSWDFMPLLNCIYGEKKHFPSCCKWHFRLCLSISTKYMVILKCLTTMLESHWVFTKEHSDHSIFLQYLCSET